MFIPDSDYIQSQIQPIVDKFAFIEDLKSTVNELKKIVTSEESAPIFYINVGKNKWFEGEVQVVNLEWYVPYKEYGDTIFCCFAYAFFIWRIFINLSSIISGAGGSVEEIASDNISYNRSISLSKKGSKGRSNKK